MPRQPPACLVSRIWILSTALLAALAVAPAGAAEPAAALKPPCHGLMVRDLQPGQRLPDFIDSAVVQVDWAELEPKDQDFSGPGWAKIEAARHQCGSLRLRIFAGTRAPVFVKRLGGPGISDPEHGTDATASGGIAIWNQWDKRGGTIPRCWESAFLDQYEELMREVARRYESAPEIAEVVASGCMTLYAEPFHRAHTDAGTNRRLRDAGLTFERDRAAQRRVIEIHARIFQRTRTSLAISTWDVIDPVTAAHTSRFAPTAILTDWARGLMGERLVLQNNGAGIEADPLRGDRTSNHFAYLKAVAGPKGFQTRTLSRLGGVDGLYRVLDTILAMGGGFAELPTGFGVADTARLADYDARLEANASGRRR
jgi:hypothetical protein